MGILSTVMAFFKGGAVISTAVEFVQKALQNKYVLMAIGIVVLLWIYDTKVQAEYTAKHAEQEIAALNDSLAGYQTAFKEMAEHVNGIYKDRLEIEQVISDPLPEYDEVIEDAGLTDIEEDIQTKPEEAIRHIEQVTLDAFQSIETTLNGGRYDN